MKDHSKSVAYAKKFFSSQVLVDDVKGLRRDEHDCERLGQELENATRNPDTNDFEVLAMLAVEFLRKNERMPDWLQTPRYCACVQAKNYIAYYTSCSREDGIAPRYVVEKVPATTPAVAIGPFPPTLLLHVVKCYLEIPSTQCDLSI